MTDLLELADKDPAERVAFLDSLPDAAVRSRLESLLELKDAERTQTIQFTPGSPGTPGGARAVVRFEGTARFEPISVLGTGGFGTVYRVFDRERNTLAALKILRERDPQVLYRFKREFRTLANLRHPNLLKLYDLFAEGERWFFTMELVEGVSFFERCSGNAAELRRALVQVVHALDHLHSQGLLHLDVKPPNVFVTTEGRVVLLDFGMVREIFGVGPRTVTLCGTPEFMAPEQLERKTPTAAADWYALGIMLHQVLTGQLPFTGTSLEIFTQKLSGKRPPSASCEGAPPDLTRLCEDLLERDPQRRPGAREILERLGEAAPAIETQTDAFVGRAAQLAAMRESWTRAERGGTVVLQISGKSGFGKSTLLRAFLDWVSQSFPEAFVLSGRCRQNESVPFKALDEAIDALSQRIASLPQDVAAALTPPSIELAARLFPVLGEICPPSVQETAAAPNVDSMELRRRAFAVLLDLFGRLSARAPLVIAIDDLQWGDADSAIFLRELLAMRRPPPMLLISSFRSEDIQTSEALRLYRVAVEERSPAVEVCAVEVGGFDTEEAGEYAARLLGAEDAPERREIIVKEAGGNPLLLSQLARYSGPEGSGASGMGLYAMIERHLAELPEAARDLLEAVALADQPLPQSIVQRVARLEADDFSGVWTLVSDRLVRTREQSGRREIECYHDKIREAVTAGLAPARRREWHRRLAHTLEEAGGAEPALLATQFAGAGESERAAHYAYLAAEAARFALAFERAAEFYQLAVEHGKHPPETRRAIFRSMAKSLACSGRGERAAAAYIAASEGAPAGEALNLQRLAAEQYLLAGSVEAGIGLLLRVVRSAGVRVPASNFGILCSLLFHRLLIAVRGLSYREREASQVPPKALLAFDVCQTASHCLAPFSHLLAANLHARELLIGLRTGEPRRVALALGRESMDLALHGTLAASRSQKVMATAQALGDRIGDARLQAQLAAFNGTRAMFLGKWRVSVDEFDRALRIRPADDAENSWLSSLIGGLYFCSLQNTGEIRLLGEQLTTRLRTFEDQGSRFGLENLKVRAAHLPWLAADDPHRARQAASQGIDQWPSVYYLTQRYLAFVALAEVDLYEAALPGAGGASLAYERVVREWKPLQASSMCRVQLIRTEAEHLRARAALALAAADPARRKRLLAEAERDARSIVRTRADWAQPMAAGIQAGIAAIQGDRQGALMELALAEQGFTANQMPLYVAAIRRQAGVLMGGNDGRARVAAADEWMAGQTIRNPERMAHMLAPGFRNFG